MATAWLQTALLIYNEKRRMKEYEDQPVPNSYHRRRSRWTGCRRSSAAQGRNPAYAGSGILRWSDDPGLGTCAPVFTMALSDGSRSGGTPGRGGLERSRSRGVSHRARTGGSVSCSACQRPADAATSVAADACAQRDPSGPGQNEDPWPGAGSLCAAGPNRRG